MKLQTASLLSAAALLVAPFGVHAQLAPYSREQLGSLFNFASKFSPSGISLLGSPLLTTATVEGEAAMLAVRPEAAWRLDFTRLSFIEAASKIPEAPPPALPAKSEADLEETGVVSGQVLPLTSSPGFPIADIGMKRGG